MGLITESFLKPSKKRGVMKIPIGTRRPYFVYKRKSGANFVKQEDVVYLNLPSNDQFSLICIMPTGYGKTRMMKRILPYMINKYHFKTLIFDCKGFEMYHGKFKTSEYKSLLPWEKPEAMDIECYMPSFVHKKAEEYRLLDSTENYFLREFKVFSYHLEDITDVLDASTLGLAPAASMIFLDKIKEKIKTGELTTVEEVLLFIKKLRVPAASKENMIRVFSFFSKEKLFDDNYPKINIIKDWNRGFTPNISLLEPEEGQASYYAGKIISDLYTKNAAEGKRKLVVVDDASKLLGSKMPQDRFLSVRKMIDTLTLGRYKKWNTIVISQSYDILNKELFPHFKYKIVGKLGSSDLNFISSFCSPEIVNAIKNLHYDPSKQIKEMLLIYPDNMSYTKFYALGPLSHHL